jgi:hypothetical protein
MKLTKKELDRRVEKDVRYMNRKHKGWLESINIGALDLSNADTCIIGEVVGDYYEEFKKADDAIAVRNGLALEEDHQTDEMFAVLTWAWVKKIAELNLRK